MKLAKFIAWLGLIAMTLGLANGFMNGDFFEDGKDLLTNPWGVMSMIDLYVGFILFSLWIAYREKKMTYRILWIVGMMVLGFFTGSIYVLIALYRSQGNWNRFWKGSRHAH